MRPESLLRMAAAALVLVGAQRDAAPRVGAVSSPGAVAGGIPLASPPLRSGSHAPMPPQEPAASGVRPHAFYFSRARYSNGFGRTPNSPYGSWTTDYPKADRQFLTVLRRLTGLDAYAYEHDVRLDDARTRRFPFLYAVEVGHMDLSETEVAGLRDYLLAGGFLMVDDFWGSYEWRNFEAQMRRVLPEYPIVDLPRDHPIFRTFYTIDEVVQVPNVGLGVAGGATHERDGYVPAVRGILDERGRLLVVINWNTDLGDAWEWAENPQYPLRFSTFAYQMGVNAIVYAMSH